MNPRSYLFVPADRADRLAKATTRGADALIIDLEDGVAPQNKADARENLRTWLESVITPSEIWVRINEDALAEDLESAVHPKVTGIIPAKSPSASQVTSVGEFITQRERALNIERKLSIIPLVESAGGIMNLLEIVKCDRVIRLMIGEQDLQADIGLPRFHDEKALDFARNSALYASAAAGIDSPIAPVSIDFTDLLKFEESTLDFQKHGFFGRLCIHPAQVEIVNKTFTPSAEDIKWAKDVLEKLEAANGGATVDAEGKMIDEAVAKRARRLL